MKLLDEYRDPAAVVRLRRAIRAATSRSWVLMEVCGGQTHSIIRHGLDERDGGSPGPAAGPGELHSARLTRARPTGDGGHPFFLFEPGAGIPGRWARLHGHGYSGVRAARTTIPRPGRGYRLRARRSA